MGNAVVLVAPRALSEKDAARYVSLSVTGFRSHAAGALRVVRFGRRKAYLREDLDRWLDHKAGIVTTVPPVNPWDSIL